MRISFEKDHDNIIFSIFSEKDDRIRNPNFGSSRRFSYKTTDGSQFPEVHPDRLALVAILNTLPFVGTDLKIGWDVSSKFLQATKIISRIKVSSTGNSQTPISRKELGRHALSFSGGADSTAALIVMPQTSELVFMLRSKSKSRSLYDSDAAIESCRKLTRLGFQVHVIESDFEYLRDPIGFPTDLSVSTPAILLAESRNFETIAFGTILESAYGTSGNKFRDYKESSHFRLWSCLFDAVGLGYSLPVAGVSEVGSSKLCKDNPIGRVHQSCIRGKWGKPCNNCWKCFRKSTLMAGLNGVPLPPESIDMISQSKEVRIKLLEDKPIKHEGVLAYALKRSSGGGDIADALRGLTRSNTLKTNWMENWYPRSSELIDESYREFTIEQLCRYLGPMSESQIDDLEGWENQNDPSREKKLRILLSILNG